MSRLLRGNLYNFDTASAPAMNPADQASLELALYSDVIVGADGSGPSGWTSTRWTDESTHTRHATLGSFSPPLLRKSGANLTPGGGQTVEFLNVAAGLTSQMGAVAIDGTNGWTFLTYYKAVTQDAGHANLILSCLTSAGMELVAYSNVAFNGYDADGKYGFQDANFAQKTVTTAATLGWHTFAVTMQPPRISTGVAQIIVDGVQLTPTRANWKTQLEGPCAIGNNVGGNSNLHGTLAAAVILSNYFTPAQVARFFSYITGRLG